MQFIIMDFEWNNAYCKKWQRSINEIIEVGAVKLDEKLNVIGKFSHFIKPQVGTKIHSRVKELCHISNEDLDGGGLPFNEVMSELADFVGDPRQSLIMTWGDTDIRVLIENFRYFENKSQIPFMCRYADLQKFCQSSMQLPKGQQVGLSKFAQLAGIDEDEFSHHRAYDDSALSARCMAKVFDEERLLGMSRACDALFYRKMNFKTHFIADINSPFVDKAKMVCRCDVCGEVATQVSEWKFYSQGFNAFFRCENCQRDMKYTVRFKRYFDRVDVKAKLTPVVKEQEDAQNGEENKKDD